ncbi:hypothetical protein V3C99_008525, partial [Haemonchus contortus]
GTPGTNSESVPSPAYTEHHHKKREQEELSDKLESKMLESSQGVTDKYLESDLAVDGSVDQAVGTL